MIIQRTWLAVQCSKEVIKFNHLFTPCCLQYGLTVVFNPRPPSVPTGIIVVSCIPNIHPERCYCSKSLRISTISLKFGGMVHSTIKHMLGQFLCIPRNFEVFHDRLGPGLGDGVTALTLQRFQPSAWNLAGWCTVPSSGLLCKVAMLS